MAFRLSTEQTQSLRDLDAKIKEATDDIQRAKRAGIDVGDMEERLKAAEGMRKGLLEQFGPTARR